MHPLYFLEHKELPKIIYSKELSKDGVAWIINDFEKICVRILDYYFNFRGYDITDFNLTGVRIKKGEETVYHIACFEFPFSTYPMNNTLCPRAYLVSETEYCINPYYYTVEYDCSSFISPEGTFFLCGWYPNKNGDLMHPNYGIVSGGRESELLSIKKITNRRMGLGDLGL